MAEKEAGKQRDLPGQHSGSWAWPLNTQPGRRLSQAAEQVVRGPSLVPWKTIPWLPGSPGLWRGSSPQSPLNAIPKYFLAQPAF